MLGSSPRLAHPKSSGDYARRRVRWTQCGRGFDSRRLHHFIAKSNGLSAKLRLYEARTRRPRLQRFSGVARAAPGPDCAHTTDAGFANRWAGGGTEFVRRGSAHTRRGWFGVVPCAAAVCLLAMLSSTSLCRCGEEGIIVQPYLDGCAAAAQRYVEIAADADVEAVGDACLGPCVDVRMLAVGAPGDDRTSVAAPALLAAPHRPTRDRFRLSPLRDRPGDSRRAAEHLEYTILRC